MFPPGLSLKNAFHRWSERIDRGFPAWRRIVSRDLAIDLGTTNTLIYLAGQDVVIDEPSVVAVDVVTNRVRSVGFDAKRMLGRTPDSILAIRPIVQGVIGDFEVAEAMIRCFIAQALRPPGIVRPRVVVSVPSGPTPVERRAVRHAVELGGGREVRLIEAALAAALGAGLPVEEPHGSLVVDVGGGTTEVAVLALGGRVCGRSSRIGGDALDAAIAQHVKREHNLLIGLNTAEAVKLAIGSAVPPDEVRKQLVRGQDAVRGMPTGVEVSSEEVYAALEEPLHAIARAVTTVLETTPPELVGDVIESGIVLTGGGALLSGLDAMLAERTGVSVAVADQPRQAVVRGAGRCLADPGLLQRLGSPSSRR